MSRRSNELTGRELDTVSRSVSKQVTTYDEVLKAFLKDGERRGLREYTMIYYRRELNDFRRYLERYNHSLFIHDIKRNHLEEFVSDMKTAGKTNNND